MKKSRYEKRGMQYVQSIRISLCDEHSTVEKMLFLLSEEILSYCCSYRGNDVNTFSIEREIHLKPSSWCECGVQCNLPDHVFEKCCNHWDNFLSSKPHKKPNIPHSRNWKHATHRHRNELKSNHIHLTTTTYMTRCLHMWWRFFFVKGESKLKFENVHVHLGVGRYCGLKQKKARKEIESPARRLAWKCLWRKL